MRRARCLSALISVLVFADLVDPARAASSGADAAPVHRNLIHLDFNLYSTQPSGSMVICKAQLVPDSQAPRGETSPAPLPSQEATGATILRGPSAVCSVEIPLCLTGNNLTGGSSAGNGRPVGVTLRYEIDATSLPGEPPVVPKRLQGMMRIVSNDLGGAVNLTLGSIP